MREVQIEEILMNAHQTDIDLIEEYFAKEDSLDLITDHAHEILKLNSSPEVHEVIKRNLSECIVVKAQIEQRSLKGFMKKTFKKLGFHFGKNREIARAEILIDQIKNRKG